MLSKNHRPTAAQKRFWDEITAMGCLITGAPAEVDHCAGASAVQDGIHIGQWWVIALSPGVHRQDAINRTTNRKEFAQRYGSRIAADFGGYAVEKEMFHNQCVKYLQYYQKALPFDWQVMQAIMAYRK